ncbi:CBS domain-containing protein [Halovenus aranensis]|jgi:CBS domain-containing protein|uniref:CBS domain-containing protein n=1 Tax=Halovenus aranensis TaxID=890420 RepID=A0A1G8V949_9EURY|nr:CBS domain-containing protein [Halovenus aranensis]SDJ62387.1 CBS domain-containing protein [Halovenus aranensis]
MTGREIPSVRDVYVGNVMTEGVETIASDRTAADAASRLYESGIGSLLVDGEDGRPDGIITETDFVELAAVGQDPTTPTVADCMSSPVLTASTDETLDDVAELMADRNVKKVPITETRAGTVVGMVTTTDIAKYLPVREFHPER